MSGRIVMAVLVGVIGTLMAVAIFQNGVDFGRWLRATTRPSR